MRARQVPWITSGTGKSHFVEALAHAAIEKEPARRLVHSRDPHRRDRESQGRRVGRPDRHPDLPQRPHRRRRPRHAARRAGRRRESCLITDAAYERRSVAVTSNIHPSGFDTIMPKTLATATVDRLLHHAHLVLTKGDSHRLAEALAGKGVIPLAT